MVCKFCNSERELIRAHVIPEGFFRRVRDGQVSPLLKSNKKNTYPKRSPIGVYDKAIVCGDCECIWGDWDAYAQDFLGDSPLGGQPLLAQGQKIGYRVDSYDYSKLKLFFIALLWRASASSQPFYAQIKLGPFEEQAKTMIRQRDPGPSEQFAVTLAKFDHPVATAMLDPHPEKWSGVNYCRFYLGGYVAYVKVDSRTGAPPLNDFEISPHRPLYVIVRDLRQSKELSLMKGILRKS